MRIMLPMLRDSRRYLSMWTINFALGDEDEKEEEEEEEGENINNLG